MFKLLSEDMTLIVLQHNIAGCLRLKKLNNNQSQLADINICAHNLATRVNWSYNYR